MAVKIRFDNQNVPESPTLVLMRRNGKRIGKLPAKEIHFTGNFNSSQELSFKVFKEENGIRNPIWDEIRSFRLVWCKEWNLVFEIYADISETNDCVKNVTATSICEAELSNIVLYGIEINTEDDIATEDYIPTVLYRSEASKKRGSLLDRLLEKAPHYSIDHVDSTIANIQRTFSFDGSSIYDALQEVATEIDCIFIFDSSVDNNGVIKRTISAYDLESNCNVCGHREEFTGVCPNCGSSNVKYGYGTDTTIFITTDNLADEIGLSTDTGAVKNCFRLECGDDIMTDVVASINPNGSRYIWYINDETKEDMSSGLVNKLNTYDTEYNYYNNIRTTSISSSLRTSYNNLVTKYRAYDSTIQTLPSQFVGFSSIVNSYFNAIDFRLYLSDELMPSIELSPTTASKEAAKLTVSAISPVAVTSLNTVSESTASSAVLAIAKTLVDPSYQVKVNNSSYSSNRWTGNFTVTSYSDDEDTATSSSITVTLTENQELYLEQAIKKKLVEVEDSTDILVLFDMTLSAFTAEIKKYCLARLVSFHDACQSCLDILLSQSVADNSLWTGGTSDLYTELYTPYYNKLIALESEMQLRESEIRIVAGEQDEKGKTIIDGVETVLLSEIISVQDHLDFEKWIGAYWKEFCSFRREDTYRNDNYISDNLGNAERIENAKEFLETAQKELFKSATLQHSISSSLKNLLVMKEFQPLTDYFEVGNWLRVRIDDKIYRLRLISYDIDFENIEDIGVDFSDVKQFVNGMSDAESILNQAKSMAGSYGSVTRQASQGEKSKTIVDGWTKQGLDMTKMRIVDQADNQSITWDSHGLLCKEYFPITDSYSPKQLKLINTGIYLTDDNWNTSKTAIGNFYYKHPETGQVIEAYGVNGETLIGTIILGEQLGIYNSSATLKFNQSGLTITNGTNTFAVNPNSSSKLLSLSNRTQDLLWVDSSGQLHIRGDGQYLDLSSNKTLSDSYATTEYVTSHIEAKAEVITAEVRRDYYNKNYVDGTFETITNVGKVEAKADEVSNSVACIVDGKTVTAAKIAVLINNSSGSSKALIEADHVVINGTTTFISKIEEIEADASQDVQVIYRTSNSNSSAPSKPSTWVTTNTNTQNTWTIRRPQYNTTYPYIYTAVQTKSIDGTVSCTNPTLDDTLTVIDGSHITTGSISSTNYNTQTGTGSSINLSNGTFNFGGGKLRFDSSGNLYVGSESKTILYANGNVQIGGTNGIKYSTTDGKVRFGSDVVISWDVPSNVITTDNQYTKITNINGTSIATGTIESDRLKATTLGAIKANIGHLIIDGYLTTNQSRTSYNQSVAGLTIDKNGIGAYSYSDTDGTKQWWLKNDGTMYANRAQIGTFYFNSDSMYFNNGYGKFQLSPYYLSMRTNESYQYSIDVNPQNGYSYIRITGKTNKFAIGYLYRFDTDRLDWLDGWGMICTDNLYLSSDKEVRISGSTGTRIYGDIVSPIKVTGTSSNISIESAGYIQIGLGVTETYTAEKAFIARNYHARIHLTAHSSGNHGLYSHTWSKWMIYMKSGHSTATDKTDVFIGAPLHVNGAVTPNSTSDIRLKENVADTDIKSALSVVNGIQMHSFDWKDAYNNEYAGRHWGIGMIADELELLDPNLTEGGGWGDEGHLEIRKKTINMLYLEGYMVKSIQELSSMQDDSKARIEELESEISELKETIKQLQNVA